MKCFQDWVRLREDRDRRHHPVVSAPYNVLPTIAAAGREGITRRELGQRVELDARLLNRLLAALGSVGLIMATEGARAPD